MRTITAETTWTELMDLQAWNVVQALIGKEDIKDAMIKNYNLTVSWQKCQGIIPTAFPIRGAS